MSLLRPVIRVLRVFLRREIEAASTQVSKLKLLCTLLVEGFRDIYASISQKFVDHDPNLDEFVRKVHAIRPEIQDRNRRHTVSREEAPDTKGGGQKEDGEQDSDAKSAQNLANVDSSVWERPFQTTEDIEKLFVGCNCNECLVLVAAIAFVVRGHCMNRTWGLGTHMFGFESDEVVLELDMECHSGLDITLLSCFGGPGILQPTVFSPTLRVF